MKDLKSYDPSSNPERKSFHAGVAFRGQSLLWVNYGPHLPQELLNRLKDWIKVISVYLDAGIVNIQITRNPNGTFTVKVVDESGVLLEEEFSLCDLVST